MKVTVKQYAQTLFELTTGKSETEVLDVVKKFAEILKNAGELKNANKIMAEFGKIYNKENGIVEVEVVTKSQSLKVEDVKEFIKKKYSAKEVEIKHIVNEKIKGGIIIRVGDEVIDGSVASQLKKLKNALSN